MRFQHFILIFCVFLFLACSFQNQSPEKEKKEIHKLLNEWHEDAAKARFQPYFEKMNEQSVFIGTDAKENWIKSDFMEYARPHFAKGKAWHFTLLDRSVFIHPDGQVAWFDELLKTSMKICRGSGVLSKQKEGWKIEQYVLSMTIPNQLVDTIVRLKAEPEDSVIQMLRQNPKGEE
jgi:hypothetical protein